MAEVRADKIFYRRRGGLTVSGGEPTAQPQGLLELLQAARAEKISTCLETCGAFPPSLADQLVELVDLFLYDVKDTDPARLRENTGADLDRILQNLRRIDEKGGASVMRCVMIPDVNLNEAHARKLAEVFLSLKHCAFVELLPYHPLGISKAQRLGEEMPRYRAPEKEELEAFAAVLRACGAAVKLYGSVLA